MKKDETERLINVIRQHFQDLYRKHKTLIVLLMPSIFLVGFSLTGILETFLYLPAAAKGTLLALWITTGVAVGIYCYKKFSPPTFRNFYRRFARKHQHPELSNALDLHLVSASAQTDFHQAAINQNISRLNREAIDSTLQNYTDSLPISRYFRGTVFLGIFALMIFSIFMILQPAATERLSHFWVSYSPPNPYTFSVEPGEIILEQGESFTPAIKFSGEVPEELTLAFKTDIEEQYRERSQKNSPPQEASFSPVSFSTNGSYYFIMDGYHTKTYPVTIQLRPRFDQLSLSVIPPEYMQLDTVEHSYPFSRIEPYKGSEIILQATTNKPVVTATLQNMQGDTIALEDSTERRFWHRWIATASDTITFQLRDSSGLKNNNNFRFNIDPKEDTAPFVSILEPSEDLKLQNPEEISLLYEAGDDFGLTNTTLHYQVQRAFSNEQIEQSVTLPTPALNQDQDFKWALQDMDLQPRDQVTFWIEVADNDQYAGPKTGSSGKRMITFSSMTDYLNELEEKENDVEESMNEISDSFDGMQQEYDQFKEQLKRNSEDNWEQQQRLKQVQQQHQAMDEQVEQLNKKFEELREEIEQNEAVSSETRQAYNELQELLKEINDPELAEALKKLQDSMEELNPDQLREAMDNFEFNEELYKERIERTKELFKSLKLNTELEKMALALDNLAETEQEISESGNDPEEELKRQQAVREDLNDVHEQLEKLEENAPKRASDTIKSLQQESQQQMKQLQQKLDENMQQLRNTDQQISPQTKQQQQEIAQQMQQLSEKMRQSKQQMNQQQQKINGAALQYIMYSLLNLSVIQEDLAQETENIPPRSKAFVDKARKQQNISRQFTMLADSLFEVSAEIPAFSNQINEKKLEVEQQLSQAVEVLSERDKSNATYAQRQSLGGINTLMSMIASLLDQLQNQHGGSGGAMSMEQLMEQMQQMSGNQQKLNQEIDEMINDIQGDRLSGDQMERLNQLSRQQNKIRKQLKELQHSGGLETGDKMLSELERLSEDMEDAINEMRGGQLDRQMTQRQQNILSRMLNAEEAVQKRGEEERRQATTAEEAPEGTPPDVTLEELQKKVRQMLDDPERTEFSEDYQRLIERYFELLKQNNIQ